MLFYNFIDNSEGIDHSEGQDIVSSTEQISKQGISCCFFFFITRNFTYEKNVCDGCYHCIIYNRTYRTVSSYFFKEIEDILENVNITRKFGWLYIEDLKNQFKAKRGNKKYIIKQSNFNWLTFKSWISMWNRTTISHKMRILPLDHKDLTN